MPAVTETWLTDILLLLTSLSLLIYWYLNSNANYFKHCGIPYLPSYPLLGLVYSFCKSPVEHIWSLYEYFPEERFFGYFQFKEPILLVKDPDLVQRIMVKDFAYFHDRGLLSVEGDPISKNLFSVKGGTWRVLRNKLIPTFTTGKLKQMFEQVDKCGDSLLEDVEKAAASEKAVEITSLIYNFPVEVTASTAFGLDFNKNNPKAVEFITKLNNAFDVTVRQIFIYFAITVLPKILNWLQIYPIEKDKLNYFMDVIKANKEYRKKNNIKRDDFFQLLINLQEMEESGKTVMPPSATHNDEDDALINQMEYVSQYSQDDTTSRLFTDEGILGQSFGFLVAGSESATNTICFTLYHIAKDVDIQKKLLEEVDLALKKNGSWTYQTVKDLRYLDQILQETQRMYPSVPIMFRECTVPYTIPDTKFVIEKGTKVSIPVAGLHMDPRYYPSPEVFNPERFVDNNYKPSPTYMPFGDGPRICIGIRFAVMEMKVCLGKILSQYSVELDSRTKEPFSYVRKSFSPKVKGGIWLTFKKRVQKSF